VRRKTQRCQLSCGLGTAAGLGSIFLFAAGRRNNGDAPIPPTGLEIISPAKTA
jgi:hypothetical protein